MASDSRHPKYRSRKSRGAYAVDKELCIRVTSSVFSLCAESKYNKIGQRARHGAKTFVTSRMRRKQKIAVRKELANYEEE